MTAIGGRYMRFCCCTQTENIKGFAYRVVSDGSVQMLSGWALFASTCYACASVAFPIGIISLSKDFKYVVFKSGLNK